MGLDLKLEFYCHLGLIVLLLRLAKDGRCGLRIFGLLACMG